MNNDVKWSTDGRIGPFTNALVGGKHLRLIEGKWTDEDGNEVRIELPTSPTLTQPERKG